MYNKKYTIADLKRISQESGNHHFDKETMKFWGAKVHGTYKHGLFIESIDNFEGTKKIFMVKAMIENSQAKIWTLVTGLDTLEEAREIVEALKKCLDNLGFREKTTMEALDSVLTYDNGVIEFFSNENADNPSGSFEILMRNGRYDIVG